MTTETIAANEYGVLQYGYVFFGLGKSKRAAITDAREWCDPDSLKGIDWWNSDTADGDMCLVLVTPRLAAAIRRGLVDRYEENEAGVYDLPEKG